MAVTRISSPHIHTAGSVTGVMLSVVYALIPALIGATWLFGWGVLINALIALVVALAAEAAMLAARGRPMRPYLLDGSAVVAALILALALPSLAPWWIPALGIAFAMVFAKHLYGGLGYNPFNPAMVAYVMLLISFPLEMTSWATPATLQEGGLTLWEGLRLSFTGELPGGLSLDALTMATPLDELKTLLARDITVSEALTASPIFAGTGRGVINGLILVGGLWLLFRRVITWHAPVGVLGTMGAVALLFYLIDPDRYASPLFHLLNGGTVLAAFFIATDPVTGATSNRGRLVFGAGVALITFIIRTWGGYPDGVAFAILLMNMAAPTIDYYTQPRVYGRERG